MAMESSVLLAALLLVPTALVVLSYALSFRGPNFPGPKGIPIIGNIVPREDPWSTLKKWSKEFGMYLYIREQVLVLTLLHRSGLRSPCSLYPNCRDQFCSGCS